MRVATCISNQQNQNVLAITEGRVYEIIRETRDFFVIVNDNGVSARYGKTRFTQAREVDQLPTQTQETATQNQGNRVRERRPAQTQQAPAPAPAPVRKTDRQIYDTITVTVDQGNTGRITVSYDAAQIVGAPRVNRSVSVSFNVNSSHISCGVHQFTNLRGLSQIDNQFRTNNFLNFQERDYDGFAEAVYAKIDDALVARFRNNCGFLIASDVHTPQREAALAAMGFVKTEGTAYNPNSQNTIAVYTKIVRAQRNDD